MGEAAYELILRLFMNAHNANMEPNRIVSNALSDLCIITAYMMVAFTLLWFTHKSILMRRAQLLYIFATFFFLCAIEQIGHLVGGYPLNAQLALDFLTGTVGLVAGVSLYLRRHFILSIVYQFKYVVGLLKTLEKLDEVDR